MINGYTEAYYTTMLNRIQKVVGERMNKETKLTDWVYFTQSEGLEEWNPEAWETMWQNELQHCRTSGQGDPTIGIDLTLED